MGRKFGFSTFTAVFNILMLSHSLTTCCGIEQSSNDLSILDVAFNKSTSSGSMKFVRLPRLPDIREITVPSDTNTNTPAFPTGATYLAQYELSLGQLKQLISPGTWESYSQRASKLIGPISDPKYRVYHDAIQNASSDYPAFAVGVRELVEITQTLNKTATFEASDIDSRIETLFFRIPSRLEWQFAARATLSSEEMESKLHFWNWLTDSEYQKFMGKIIDLAKKLNREIPEKLMSQADFLSLIEQAEMRDDTRREALELLGEILKVSLGLEVNISQPNQAGLREIMSAKPNSWGFYHIIGNVSEWCLMDKNPDQLRDHWQRLLETQDLSLEAEKEFGLVMGGNFLHVAQIIGKWRNYSIAAGAIDSTTKSIVAYRVEQSLDSPNVAIDDEMAGVRLLAERRLAPNWFAALRSDLYLVPSNDSSEKIAAFYSDKINEIAEGNELERSLAFVSYYSRLSMTKDSPADFEWSSLCDPASRFRARAKEKESTGDALAQMRAILGEAPSGGSGTASNDSDENKPLKTQSEADFFSIFAQVLATEDQLLR
jgi:hypothetical protein